PAYLAYLFGGARAGRRLVMDVTPAYASLPEARLRQMAGMADDVRILYLMRDPVARFWSHVRMIAERSVRAVADVPAAARALLDAILDGQPSAAVDRGDYAGALARLDAAVAPGRLLVMFQEELMTAPGYGRLCGFLGIAPGQPDFGRRVFASAPVEMTAAQRARLGQFLAPQYATVAARGPLPAAWRRAMEGGAA
ncbi:MAG TPA: sulfotransferase family protein, partial [Paracoccaceae bacterium]|nr:sulfotransferase family protein [Paracoccaceae bacterium]